MRRNLKGGKLKGGGPMTRWVATLSVLLLLGCPNGKDDTHGNGGGSDTGERQVPDQPAEPFGRFEGDVVAVWDDDERNMTLREDFAYIAPGPDGKRWEAKAGTIVNGASIPKPFWSLIGGPFEGKYRKASVVHDAACGQMTDTWQSVHRMFYDACRCGGVGETKAKVMYWAVYKFGPRWNLVSEMRTRTLPDGTTEQYEVRRGVVIMAFRNEPLSEDLPQQAEEYFQNRELSLDEIEALSVADVQQGEGASGVLPVE